MDTDELKGVDLAVETADNLINEYRSIYSAGTTPHDKLFKDVALLYRTKEAATIVEAYAQLSEKVMRKHEGMVGWVVGSKLLSIFVFEMIRTAPRYMAISELHPLEL